MALESLIANQTQMGGLITTAIRRQFIPILLNKLRFAPFAKAGKLEMNGRAIALRWNLAAEIGTFATALGEITTTQNEIYTITITSVVQTVSDYGAFAKMSDLADSAWGSETRAEFRDIFAYSGAKTMDLLLYQAADDTTNYVVAQALASGASTMFSTTTAIAQDLNVIRGFFDQNDCDPFDELGANYVVIIHGEVEQDMVADVTTGRLSWSPLIQNYAEAGQRITNYKGPGTLLGVAVQRSNQITTVVLTTSSTPVGSPGTGLTVYKCIALADHGIGKTTLDQADPRIIMKRPGPGTVSVPLDTYGTIGWKMRMGQGLLSATRALVYYAAK